MRESVEDTRRGFATCGRGENAVTLSSARSRLLIPAGLCLLFVLTFSASARATIQYTVLLDHPERHLFHVTMTIPDVTTKLWVELPRGMRFTRYAISAVTCKKWRPLRIHTNCSSKRWTNKRGALKGTERSRFLTRRIGTRPVLL